MGGSDNISIVLDSPTNSYYAGTNLTGRIIVNADKPLDIRSLVLKVQGKAHVTWEENESETETRRDGTTDTATRYVTYSSEEEYFTNKYNILGETEIPPGQQVYPFCSPLPPMLPSSFNGEYGSVKYTVKATIDRPWKFDQEAKVECNIVTPLDLNYNPVAKEAVRREAEKFFCCFCCQSGPLSLILSLPYTGYVAGQAMTLTIEADNASNVEIDSVVCFLKKDIKWTCYRPSQREKVTTTEIIKVSLEGVSARDSKSWSQQIIIPEMPFINLQGCSLIRITHRLVVEAQVSGCHSNLSIEVPLIIGSVPIQTGPGGVSPIFPNQPAGGITVSPGMGAGGPLDHMVSPVAPIEGGGYPMGGYPQGYPPPAVEAYPPAPADSVYSPSAPPLSPPNSSASQPLLNPDAVSNVIGFKLPSLPSFTSK